MLHHVIDYRLEIRGMMAARAGHQSHQAGLLSGLVMWRTILDWWREGQYWTGEVKDNTGLVKWKTILDWWSEGQYCRVVKWTPCYHLHWLPEVMGIPEWLSGEMWNKAVISKNVGARWAKWADLTQGPPPWGWLSFWPCSSSLVLGVRGARGGRGAARHTASVYGGGQNWTN